MRDRSDKHFVPKAPCTRVTCKPILAGDQLSIAEVGFLLGFSELSSFYRAFKRWTGRTPAEFRQELRSRSLIERRHEESPRLRRGAMGQQFRPVASMSSDRFFRITRSSSADADDNRRYNTSSMPPPPTKRAPGGVAGKLALDLG